MKKRQIRILSVIMVFILTVVSLPTHNQSVRAASFNKKSKIQKLRKQSVSKTSVKLTWKKLKKSTGYEVFYTVSSQKKFKKATTVKTNKATIRKLKPGKKYRFKVRAYQRVKGRKIYSRFSKALTVRTKKQPSVPAASSPVSASPAPVTMLQKLNYAETTDSILNPDQGFYRPISVRMKADGASYNPNIVNDNTQLYHLRIDISSFSKAAGAESDAELSEAALNDLEQLLSYLQEKEKNAVARFAYDPYYEGKKDMEPSTDMMLQHIRQASAVLEKYPDTITAIEVGMVGPWGEMHSSALANKETINALIDEFLDNTSDIPILVRTPAMIYNYLGISIKEIENTSILPTDKAYRLGLFNDGYLGSESDLGTYNDREREIAWLSRQTNHLPYGGEVMNSSEQRYLVNCASEMFLMNLSYLNIEWNNKTIDEWKDTIYTAETGTDSLYYGKSCFDYIQNHMGYRFVLTASSFTYPETLEQLGIKLSLRNIGFGNLNRTKQLTLIFEAENGETVSMQTGTYSGKETISMQIPLHLKSGKYKVYLRMDNGQGRYAIQWANNLWNSKLRANQIGDITIP